MRLISREKKRVLRIPLRTIDIYPCLEAEDEDRDQINQKEV